MGCELYVGEELELLYDCCEPYVGEELELLYELAVTGWPLLALDPLVDVTPRLVLLLPSGRWLCPSLRWRVLWRTGR